MRYLLALLGAAGLAGCDSSPQSLGITGPGAPAAQSPAADESPIVPPGISNTGGSYRYNIGPTQSGDRYFNYN
ncbi:MAG TPA: hypothetical protein VH855_13220 [Acetobacteraceae bacterium]|jgi:hypothetical protein